MTSTTSPLQYQAFISYRHADNTEQGRQWATWLHQEIEHYEVPADLVGTQNQRGETIPERIYPVFRDEQELPAHADLGAAIVGALEHSKLLVVLCSPRAAQSTYVAQEIDYFKTHDRSEAIIAAIIDGEPNTSWDLGKQQSVWSKDDECFPQPLLYEYDDSGQPTHKHAEPIAADFRVEEDGKLVQGWTTPLAYRQHLQQSSGLGKDQINKRVDAYSEQLDLMVLKIISGILAIPLRDLTQRDKAYQLEQEQRRSKRLRRWLAAVALLAIIAVIAGTVALQQRQTALEQRQLAMEQRDRAAISQSHFLMDQAGKANDQGLYDQALLLGLHALPGQYGGDRPLIKNQHTLRTAVAKTQKLIEFPHQGVEHVAYSPNGTLVATASKDGRAVVWTTGQGEKKFTFEHHREIDALEFSPDGRLLIIAAGLKLHLWSLDNGKQLPFAADYGYADSFRISSDSRYLIMNPGGGIVVCSIAEQKVVYRFKTGKGSLDYGFSPDGKLIFATHLDGSISIWNCDDGQLAYTLEHKSMVYSTSFSPDSLNLVTTLGQTTMVWDLTTGQLSQTLHDEETSNKAAFVNKDFIVTSALDSGLSLWSWREGKKMFQTGTMLPGTPFSFKINRKQHLIAIDNNSSLSLLHFTKMTCTRLYHEEDISDFAIAPDGNSILTASDGGGAALWTTTSEELKFFWNQHVGGLKKVSASPNGHWIAAYENTKNLIHLYSLKDGKAGPQLNVPFRTALLRFCPDSSLLVSVTEKGQVDIWHVEDGSKLLNFEAGQGEFEASAAFDVQFLPDNRIALLYQNSIYPEQTRFEIWSTSTTTKLIEKTYAGRLKRAYLNPAADQVLGITSKGAVMAWDLKAFEPLWQWDGEAPVENLTVTQDGKQVALRCENGDVQILAAADGTARKPTVKELKGEHLQFSHNGKYLALWDNQFVQLWSLMEDKKLFTIDLHRSYPNLVQFSPDDELLAVAGNDIQLFAIPGGELFYMPATDSGSYQLTFSPDSQLLITASSSVMLTDRPQYIMKGILGKNLEVWRLFRNNLPALAQQKLPTYRQELSEQEKSMFYLDN